MLLPIEDDTVHNELLKVLHFLNKRYFTFEPVMSSFAYRIGSPFSHTGQHWHFSLPEPVSS